MKAKEDFLMRELSELQKQPSKNMPRMKEIEKELGWEEGSPVLWSGSKNKNVDVFPGTENKV